MFDYEAIKELARVPGLRASDLIVLSPGNDPFYAGVPARRERAEWFADIWQSFGYSGAHIRRIHYIMISQPEPGRSRNLPRRSADRPPSAPREPQFGQPGLFVSTL
jgi:hypothetical protein